MLTYLHDIRNKLTLIAGHTTILSNKYGEEDFRPIRTNLSRITDIINEAYRFIQQELEECKQAFSSSEFVRQMDLLTDTAELLYPIEVKNEIRDYRPKGDFQVDFNTSLIFQVIENAIDNSLKAGASKLNFRLLECDKNCIFEIIDNGEEKKSAPSLQVQDNSAIPHGIGKEIMIKNMEKVQGKIDWTKRLDHSGMVVRLYFPKKV